MTDSENDNLDEENNDDDENLKYYDFDDDSMHTLFFKKTEIDKIKIDKVKDYYDLFVSMLKIEEKDLHTHEHFALRTEWDYRYRRNWLRCLCLYCNFGLCKLF